MAFLPITLLVSLFLMSGCQGGSIWQVPIGTSVLDGLFGAGGEEPQEQEKIAPLVSYDGLKSNLPGGLPGYSDVAKAPVGEKLLDGMVPSSGFKAEPIDPRYVEINDQIQAFGVLDISSFGGGGDGFEMPEPGKVPFPLSDLNKDPYVESPFIGIESVPRSPSTEFFFNEVQKRPQFFD